MRNLTLALGLALLSACAPKPAAKPPAPPPAPAAAPAPVAAEPMSLTFSGEMLCADCPGIQTTLTLTRKAPGWAEGTYRLSETYLERGGPFITTGDWTTLRGDAVDPDATVYELNPDKPDEARHYLRVGDDTALRALTQDMKTLPPSLPDTLKRVK